MYVLLCSPHGIYVFGTALCGYYVVSEVEYEPLPVDVSTYRSKAAVLLLFVFLLLLLFFFFIVVVFFLLVLW